MRNETPATSPKLVIIGITMLLGSRWKKKEREEIITERKLMEIESIVMEIEESITIKGSDIEFI